MQYNNNVLYINTSIQPQFTNNITYNFSALPITNSTFGFDLTRGIETLLLFHFPFFHLLWLLLSLLAHFCLLEDMVG